MKKEILLIIFLIFLTNLSFAGNNLGLDKECFSLEGSSGEYTKLIEAVYSQLKSSGIVSPDFPVYSKTEIVGESTKPHTLKAVPVASVQLADSILISEGKFITFEVWGLNQAGSHLSDFVYLLKEKDEEAIRNGFKGIQRYKYIDICYASLMPITKTGRIEGDFSESNKIITLVRQGLLKSSCKKVKCYYNKWYEQTFP